MSTCSSRVGCQILWRARAILTTLVSGSVSTRTATTALHAHVDADVQLDLAPPALDGEQGTRGGVNALPVHALGDEAGLARAPAILVEALERDRPERLPLARVVCLALSAELPWHPGLVRPVAEDLGFVVHVDGQIGIDARALA